MGFIPSSMSRKDAYIPAGPKPTIIVFLSPDTGRYLIILSVLEGDSLIKTEQERTYTGNFPLASTDLFSGTTAVISARSFPSFFAAALYRNSLSSIEEGGTTKSVFVIIYSPLFGGKIQEIMLINISLL